MPEHDLITAVEAARKTRGRGPFVGIANGHGTMMFSRPRLKATLKGLRIIDAEVGPYQSEISNLRSDRALIVHAVSEDGRVKAKRVFLPVVCWKMSPLLESWQRAERRKLGYCDCHEFKRFKICKHVEAAKPKTKETKYAAAIRKLEKQMPKEYRPWNPIIPRCEPQPASDSTRQSWHEWKMQRNVRREIMRIARSDMTMPKRYQAIAKLTVTEYDMVNFYEYFNSPKETQPEPIYRLVTKAVSVKRWSDLKTHEREKAGGDLFGYLKVLWQFCGLANKPYHDDYEPKWGASRYRDWLENLYERKEITAQIAAIRAEAEGANV